VKGIAPDEAALIAIASLSAILWTGGLIARQVRPHKRDVDIGSGLRLLGFAIFVPTLYVCFPHALQAMAAIYAALNLISAAFQWLMYKVGGQFRNDKTTQASIAFYDDLIASVRWLIVSVLLSAIVAVFPTGIASAGASLIAAFIGYQLLTSYLAREGEEYIEESLFQAFHALRGLWQTARKLRKRNNDKKPDG
jgi:hypothetical protein